MQDLEKIKDTNSWQRWPILPLVRRSENFPQVAVIVEVEETRANGMYLLLEGQNMFGKLDVSKGVLRTAEEIITAGWVVD